jgi:hypothetical protein
MYPIFLTNINHGKLVCLGDMYHFIWVYPKITVSLKFLLFYPNPKGDKRNFKLVPVQKWDTPLYFDGYFL